MGRPLMGRVGVGIVVGVVGVLASAGSARADVQHTIARGHTLEAIANRYHVTVKAIVEANHLKDVKHLRVGEVLTIPTKDAPGSSSSKAKTGADDARGKKSAGADHAGGATGNKKGEKTAKVGAAAGRETTNFAMKPKTPGVIHVKRIATNEEFDIHVGDKRGRVSPTALKTFEKMMRAPGGMAHPIEPRLVSLLGIVSNHFGSRKIEVVSGFRPFTPTQYNPHSNHNHGKAVDFRVVGVPNETVRDFCRTLKNTGCGYYPNSVFVHMDVREQSAFWIDYSKPGEAPRYNAPNVEADEGTSDVHSATGEAGGSDTSNTAPSAAEPSAPPTETTAPATNGPTTNTPATSAPATNGTATNAPATSAPATNGTATNGTATNAPATSAPASAPSTKSDEN